MSVFRDLTEGEEEVIELVWRHMPKDPEHDDRVLTDVGSKTKLGLVRVIRTLLEEDKWARKKT